MSTARAKRKSNAAPTQSAAGRGEGGSREDIAGELSAPSQASDEPRADLTPVVGKNLKRFRVERGLSLEALAKASGVSRAMLGQVELGQSTPTINVVWKIARAFDLPFSALITQESQRGTTVLPKARARLLKSQDGAFTSRALFPMDRPRNVEFYELRLAAHSIEAADAHPPGTMENLVVTAGSINIAAGGVVHRLATGDAILFEADTPHQYDNAEGAVEAVMYLVMTYAKRAQ